jgi:hypothetical protein
MAILYSYPSVKVAFTDSILGTQLDKDGNPTKSFLVKDLINLVETTTVSNDTTVNLTSYQLNDLYPGAMVGFKVQCVDLSTPKIYEKTAQTSVGTDTTWFSYNITPVS